MFRFWVWAGWITLGLFFTAVVLVIALRIAYQYVNTVVGDSTVIVYNFTPKDASFQPIFELIARVAQENGLERNGTSTAGDGRAASWSTPSRWFGKRRQRVTFYVDASPHDEPDARKLSGHVSISTEEADTGNAWQIAAKNLETALAPHVQFEKAHVQLDSRVYGLCASKDRPNRLDTTCFYPLAVPVDLDRLNAEILQPRASNIRPTR